MNLRKPSASDFSRIIKDLREYRRKLQNAIVAFEALQNGDIPPIEATTDVLSGATRSPVSFGGMQFLEAARRLLAESHKPLTTSEISDELLERGFTFESDKPKKVVAAQLHRYANKTDSGIVKKGPGLWSQGPARRR